MLLKKKKVCLVNGTLKKLALSFKSLILGVWISDRGPAWKWFRL